MITDDDARVHVAETVGQREELRVQLARLLPQNTESAHNEYQQLLKTQALVLGKLGGLYIALGMDQQLIHSMLADTYWSGLGDKQREYGDL